MNNRREERKEADLPRTGLRQIRFYFYSERFLAFASWTGTQDAFDQSPKTQGQQDWLRHPSRFSKAGIIGFSICTALRGVFGTAA
jgi:hypothetical protein